MEGRLIEVRLYIYIYIYDATIIFRKLHFIVLKGEYRSPFGFLNEKGKLGLFIQNFMQNRMVFSEFPSTMHTSTCSLYESKFAC